MASSNNSVCVCPGCTGLGPRVTSTPRRFTTPDPQISFCENENLRNPMARIYRLASGETILVRISRMATKRVRLETKGAAKLSKAELASLQAVCAFIESGKLGK